MTSAAPTHPAALPSNEARRPRRHSQAWPQALQEPGAREIIPPAGAAPLYGRSLPASTALSQSSGLSGRFENTGLPQSIRPVGAARSRRLKRLHRAGRVRDRRLPLWLLSMVLAGLFLCAPAGSIRAGRLTAGFPMLPGAAVSTGASLSTPAPTQTVAHPAGEEQSRPAFIASPTPSPTPTGTSTATPTPITPQEATATAWQTRIDQAAATSFALQTQNARQYAATQTALPYTVQALKTSMAQAATSTP